MFHLVFMIDPEHEDARSLVLAAEIFWANDVPLRIGEILRAAWRSG